MPLAGGGPGDDTGLQDAANLGWKLAAAIQGWGGEWLLDSYHEECYPVGRQVLRSSGALLRLALIHSPWAWHARNVIGELLLRVPAGAAAVAGTISGISVRYSAPPGSDRRVGTRMPDIALTTGRLHEALRGGRFVLIGSGAASVDRPPQVDAATPVRPTGELVLVRPDGYVAWVGTAPHFPDGARGYFRWPRSLGVGGSSRTANPPWDHR